MSLYPIVDSNQDGLGLLALVLWTGILVALLLALQLQIANLASATAGLDAELYSFVLAENGLEYARSIMQSVEAQNLITGPDGNIAVKVAEGWRNPLSFAEARALDLEESAWHSTLDDGLPWAPEDGRVLVPLRLANGQIFLRFSNNPEEGREEDRDGELIVRSMGVVPSAPLHNYFRSSIKNQVSLLEARFRHSRYFVSPAPILLWNSTTEWEGELNLEPSPDPVVGWVRTDGDLDQLGALRTELGAYLEEPEWQIEDLTSYFGDDRHRAVMFRESFWLKLATNLPSFLDERSDSHVTLVDEDAALTGTHRGLILSTGALQLESDFRLEGLLLQVGSGDLRVSSHAQLQGAVWKVCPEVSSDCGTLILEEAVQIRMDEGLVEMAMKKLPADLVGFRQIFPEMQQ